MWSTFFPLFNREHLDKEELTELKTELSEHVKSLDQLTNEIENSISEPV